MLPQLRPPRRLRSVTRVKKISPPPALARVKYEAPTEGMSDKVKRAYYDICGESDERVRIAKRFGRLLEEYTVITLPEAIYYEGMEQRKREFDYQSALMGGRSELGGLVVDFMVRIPGGWLAVLVNGDFWHNKPMQRERDFQTKERAIGLNYQDGTILYSIEIWESTLKSCFRDHAIDQSLLGIEVGQMAG